jgi:osmoprotectant transport system ATP-binding protein
LRELRSGSAALAAADRDESLEVVTLQSTLNDALDTMLTSSHGVVVVTGRRDTYQGVIRVETITNAIQSMRASAESSTPSEEQSGGGVHTP